MQGHGQPLAEHDGTRAFGLQLAGGQGRRLGKLRPNAPDHFAPASADGFHDHRDEGDTLSRALSFGLLMLTLEVLVFGQGSIRIPHRIGYGLKPEPAGDGKIPGGRGPGPPPRNVHVSRATSAGASKGITNGVSILGKRAAEWPLKDASCKYIYIYISAGPCFSRGVRLRRIESLMTSCYPQVLQ